MSDTLLIHYNIDSCNQATWSLCNDAGELTARISTGSLGELGEFAAGRPAVVLLNSQCLHINQLQLPTQNMQKMLKAVPYALEEFIAEDIENFHFVISRNKHNNKTSVAGIKKNTLQNIIQIFQQAGISVDKIIPDVLCLAADPGNKQWVCLKHGDHSYLQTDILNGMLLSNEILPYALSSLLRDKKQEPPEKILFFNEQEDAEAFTNIPVEDQMEDRQIELVNIAYNTHPLVVFCGHYKQALPLNLLQNEFKPRRKSSGYLHHWRLTASLAAVWMALHLGLTGFQLTKLTEENRQTRAEIEKIYKKSFPKSRKIINPRAQMEQKLNELKNTSGNNSNGLIFLLAESFGTINQDRENITLQSITFRNNRMEIALDSKNLQAIENLNRSLNKNTRIKSEITSSTSEKDKVRGNLRIEGRS